ncbi:MAG: LapA family protein [Oscillospiraceae bacterium]|nr:LapA family protein [Oscillospiraceae bacterium]
MKLTFLAVVIVMIVLIGFVLLVLRSLTISAGIRIRADMVKLLQSYDRILEEKSREIKRLQKELEEMPDPAARPEPVQSEPVSTEPQERGSASIPEAAEYRHSAFGDSYGAVRDYFMLSEQDKQALVEQVRKEEAGTPRGAAAAALRQSLSYDTVFRMTLLSPEEQLRLLDTSLNDNDWTLLRDFCEEQGDTPFNITRFCDWLEELSHLESGEILVRGSGDASGDGQNGICEGIRIVVGNKLYDYSIDEREIS